MTIKGPLQAAWEDREMVGKFLADETALELNTETAQDQLAALLLAFAIFLDRNQRYGDLWKKYGVSDNLLQARHKLARADTILFGTDWTGHQITADDLDDLFDLVNYTIFAIRNAMAGNMKGEG